MNVNKHNGQTYCVSVLTDGDAALPCISEEDLCLHLKKSVILSSIQLFLITRLIRRGLTSLLDELHNIRKRFSARRNWGRRYSCPFERPKRLRSRNVQRARVIFLQLSVLIVKKYAHLGECIQCISQGYA